MKEERKVISKIKKDIIIEDDVLEAVVEKDLKRNKGVSERERLKREAAKQREPLNAKQLVTATGRTGAEVITPDHIGLLTPLGSTSSGKS